MKPFLLSPDPGAGSSSDPSGVDAGSPQPGASPDPAAPPAAAVVLASDVSESDAGELVKTKRELEDERKARKGEQTRLSELEDENRRLKSAGLNPNPPPAPAAKQKRGWLDGLGTVLDD